MRQYALVNPDVLVWARESINMDVEEAARKVNVKPQRLREWERGDRRPTINQARKLSQVYRRPLAAFYLPQRPSSLGFSVPHDYRRLPADQPRELSPELITELRRIEYLRDAAIRFAEYRPEEPREFVKSITYDESSRTVAGKVIEILELPMAGRLEWKNEYDALNGWKDAIEKQGVLVMHLNRVGVEEIRGIAIADDVFPLIAVNGKDHPNARIFTLIHEFIHLMLGATGLSNMRVARRARTPEQRTERFCNAVAGEVLVPREDLLSHDLVRNTTGPVEWSDEIIEELAGHFHVSREVVVRRMVIVNRATEDFYRRMRRQYSEERDSSRRPSGGPIPMPRRIIRAIGQPFARIAVSAYYREAISGSELSELLGARLKHLVGVESLLGGRNVLTGGDR